MAAPAWGQAPAVVVGAAMAQTGALAPLAAERLFETIRAINADGVAIVMVEQNALEALAIARRGYILVDGRNSASGDAAALAADPDVRRIFLGG